MARADEKDFVLFNGIKYEWLGQSTVRMTFNGFTVYTDPVTLDPDPPKAGLILITHHHVDHCLPEFITPIRDDKTKLAAFHDSYIKYCVQDIKGVRTVKVQTGGFSAGDYWVFARALDIGGNVTSDSMMCTVAGATSPVAVVPELSHDFGGLPVGAEASWDIVVRNTGADPLSVREVTSSDPAFRVNRSHFFVPPGGEVPITVRFLPGAVQSYSGTIRIRTNDLLHPQFNVTAQGSGSIPRR